MISSGMTRVTAATLLSTPWTVTAASTNPSSIEPESPMKMDAGKKLCRRKPSVVPARMAARMPASGRPMEMAMTAKVPAAMVQTPAARPSMPSMKLTMLTSATTQISVRVIASAGADVDGADERQREIIDAHAVPDQAAGGDELAGELDQRRGAAEVVDGAEEGDDRSARPARLSSARSTPGRAAPG